jgi:hypothetical protein
MFACLLYTQGGTAAEKPAALERYGSAIVAWKMDSERSRSRDRRHTCRPIGRQEGPIHGDPDLDAGFDGFDADVNALSTRALADGLMALIFELFTSPAFTKLLNAGGNWSIKREEFRRALLQRIAKTLMIHTPNLSKKSAADIALVILLNVKTVATYQAFFDSASSAPDEFRDMTRLYLQSRLGSSISRKTRTRHDGECAFCNR